MARLDPATGALAEYVIAAPQLTKAQGKPPAPAYATVSNWPDRKVRGAVHFVLSREVAGSARLAVGSERFTLVTKGRNAWAKDAAGNVSLSRSASVTITTGCPAQAVQ